jgi:hypothetical protein
MSTFLDEVNRTEVSAELLADVIELLASLPPDERWTTGARAARLFRLLDRKGLASQSDELAVAIDLRVAALVRLQQDETLRAWSAPSVRPGVTGVHRDLVKAAAAEPLVEDAAGEPCFEPKSFLRRLLAVAEARGRA